MLSDKKGFLWHLFSVQTLTPKSQIYLVTSQIEGLNECYQTLSLLK